jgi:hypothetical protein
LTHDASVVNAFSPCKNKTHNRYSVIHRGEWKMPGIAQGLWSVEIGGPQGVIPGGVIVCKNGQVFGGDNRYYYAGRYDVEDGRFQAHITVTHYQDLPEEFFGDSKDLPFDISGVFSDSQIDCEGALPARAENHFMVRLTKLRDVD